jgi:hypothetical protein
MAIFVLISGDYNYRRNLLATSNVKLVAKEYVNIINEGGYGDLYTHPYVEIRVADAMERYPVTFSEKTNDERRLVKYLSKRAWELEAKEVNEGD